MHYQKARVSIVWVEGIVRRLGLNKIELTFITEEDILSHKTEIKTFIISNITSASHFQSANTLAL